ncbi:hypothetical protein ABZT48_36940 [Streptomyces avermitilis]|uniref:hypothetical protein n=1 Tax=Streptomyces avermitilis TaxID=33903 RepID=UPI0033A047C8
MRGKQAIGAGVLGLALVSGAGWAAQATTSETTASQAAAAKAPVRAAALDRYIPYGRASRTAVLDQLAEHLNRAVSRHGLWPGDGLLPPLSQRT